MDAHVLQVQAVDVQNAIIVSNKEFASFKGTTVQDCSYNIHGRIQLASSREGELM